MNLEKYKYYRFHKDNEINQQISALLLKFDFEVNRMKLNEEDQIGLLSDWVITFEKHGNSNYLEVFKQRKALLQTNVIFDSGLNIDNVESKIYKMSINDRLKTFFKSFLKKA